MAARTYRRKRNLRGRPYAPRRLALVKKQGPTRHALRGRHRAAPAPRMLGKGHSRLGWTSHVPGALIRNLNGNLTESAFNRTLGKVTPRVKHMEEITTPQIYTTQETARQDNAFGFQKANSFEFLTQTDLYTLWSNLNSSGALNNVAGTVGASYVPNRFIVESVQVAINFANVSTAPVELTLYDIVPKRDIPNKLTYNVGIPLTPATFYHSPESYWNVGSLLNNGMSPLSVVPPYPSQFLGARPTDSTPFNDYFKIVAKKRILLSQGGVHRHTISIKVNKFIDSFMINAVSPADVSAPWGQRKLSHYLMYNASGLPVSDLSGSDVTTSDTHLDIVASYRYKYSAVVNNSLLVKNTDQLTTPANANIVNVGSGKVEPITFAP